MMNVDKRELSLRWRSKQFVFGAIAVMALCGSGGARADVAGVPLHGFANVDYGRASPGQPLREVTRGFNLGTLDFYLTPQFSDNVKALAELAFEPGLDTGSIGTDVERLQIGYTFNDLLTAWVGRFHTPLGYWNTAYHHGAALQPSVYRPRFLDFEDHAGALPVHSTGLWLTGGYKFSPGKLTWDVYVANGNRLTYDSSVAGGGATQGTLDMNITRADKSAASFGGNLGFNFSNALDGLRVGACGMYNNIDNYSTVSMGAYADGHNQFKIFGPYAVYENNGFESITELYRIMDNNLDKPTEDTHKSWAGFTHFSYSFMADVTGYFRLERAIFDQTDRVFSYQINGFSYNRELLGLRFNLNPRSVIKLEYNHTTALNTNSNITAGNFNEGKVQYAIAF